MSRLLSLYTAHVTFAAIGTVIVILIGLAFRVLLFVQPGKRNPLWRQLFFKKSQEPN